MQPQLWGSQWFLETQIETITTQTHSIPLNALPVLSCKNGGSGHCTFWNTPQLLGLILFQLRFVHLYPGYFLSKQAVEVPSQGPVNSSVRNIHQLLRTGPINYNVQKAPPQCSPYFSRIPSHPHLAAPDLIPTQKCHWDPGAVSLPNWWWGWQGAEVQGVLQKHGAWSAREGQNEHMGLLRCCSTRSPAVRNSRQEMHGAPLGLVKEQVGTALP